jgi:hypothetical protein
MISSSQKSESFVKVILVTISVVLASQLDAAFVQIADKSSRCCDASILRSNIVLETGPLVNTQLTAFVNWSTKAAIVLAGIEIVSVVFGIVDVLFWAVAAETFSSDFELLCSETEAQKAENPQQETDRFCADHLDRAYIYSLRVISYCEEH